MDNATRDQFITVRFPFRFLLYARTFLRISDYLYHAQHLVKELDDWKRASGHRNISPFLGITDGVSWEHLPSLVTPMYSNGNIHQYLRRNPKANLLSLLHNVADALTYMHSLNPPVVHGGVQGANIFISDEGEAHLSDLCINFLPRPPGIAVAGDELEAERWMAPEILDPSPELQSDYNVTTPETDIYSFGMAMLELFSGSRPYVNKRFTAAVICAVVEGVKPPRPNTESLTDEIWNLIKLCWAHNPWDRPSMALVRSSIHALWLRSLSSSYPRCR
ncbi:TKL/TKL-ccin protein kinase [Lyophyllum atratum]|nr:TKL/TKL-ccin protein kinase [Lyophyllum atratum]